MHSLCVWLSKIYANTSQLVLFDPKHLKYWNNTAACGSMVIDEINFIEEYCNYLWLLGTHSNTYCAESCN